jgi:glycosyltransferase involved in cell wall biosynthesis
MHTPRALGEMAAGAAGVARTARRVRPSLVHANTMRAGLIACAAGAAHGVGGARVVVHARDWVPEGRASQMTLGWVRGHASAVIANSAFTARQFPPRDGAPPVDVVANPIDMRSFDPATVSRTEARRAIGVPEDGVLLGVVGQLTPWKGQDDAIRTLAALRARGDAPAGGVRLVIAGSAKFAAPSTRFDNLAYARELEALPAQVGVADAVTFLGERRDVPVVLRALDLLLLPSWREAFGRIAVEAMAMEVPVVATNVGGPAEIVRDGIDGRSLPPHDPSRWAAVIAELLADPGTLRAMGTRGRAAALERFAIAPVVRDVLAVYERVMAPTSA